MLVQNNKLKIQNQCQILILQKHNIETHYNLSSRKLTISTKLRDFGRRETMNILMTMT